MKHDFTAIHTAFDEFVSAMKAMKLTLIQQADAEREELLSLHARMRDTQNDLFELGVLADEASDAIGEVASGSCHCADLIGDVLDTGLVPECNYEDLVGYCAVCGRTITSADDYDVDEDDEMLCADCAAHSEDEDEDGGKDEDKDESEPSDKDESSDEE